MAGLHVEVRAHGLSPAIPEGKLQMASMQANVAMGVFYMASPVLTFKIWISHQI